MENNLSSNRMHSTPTTSTKQYMVRGVAILILACLIRIMAANGWHEQARKEGNLFRFGDSHSYWTLADHLAKGQAYEYGGSEAKIFRAPLYPLFLVPFASMKSIDRGVLAARWAGAVLQTLGIAFLMAIAWRFAGPFARDLTGLLAACYPGAIGMSIFVLSEALFTPLLALALWWVTFPTSKPSDLPLGQPQAASPVPLWRWFLAGITMGLACLTRPSWILFPAWWFALESLHPSTRSQLGKKSLALGLGMILIMSPWWIRNYLITDRFVPTTLQVGATLYDGWHDGASGGSDEGMAFVSTKATELRQREAKAGPQASTFEYRLNQFLMQEAVAWATQHPSQAIQSAFAKSYRTWTPWPRAEQVGNRLLRWAECIGYLTLLALAIYLAFAHSSLAFSMRLMWYPTLYYAMLHTVFVGSIRYRHPPLFLLAAMAGVGVHHWLQRRRQRAET